MRVRVTLKEEYRNLYKDLETACYQGYDNIIITYIYRVRLFSCISILLFNFKWIACYLTSLLFFFNFLSFVFTKTLLKIAKNTNITSMYVY